MPAISITKTYQDGDILTEADLDNIRDSIESFINTTGLDTDNIQAGGIAASDLGINDDQYIEFGTGNDGAIGVSADDLYIKNVTSNKDIIFSAAPSGTPTEIMRVDASAQTLVMNSKKITGLANANTANNDEAVNVATLKAFLPVGTIMAYSAASAPTGFLLCDGSAVSRTTYADLFAVIAETAGQGDNSLTFNVPDFRGRFLRGWDNGAARDPDAASRTAMNTGGNTGDAIFSVQDDEFESHTHGAKRGGADVALGPGSGYSINAGGDITTTSTGGNETRPKNATVNYIIKY